MTLFRGYIGTYTKEQSKGIYRFTLNTETEKIENVEVAAELGSPTYVSLSRDNKMLYSVIKQGDFGGVAAFHVNDETGDLKLINYRIAAGASPCHVSVDTPNNNVLTANYHKGTVDLHVMDPASIQLSPSVATIEHIGSSENDERQEQPHMHFSGYSLDEKFIVVIDLGTDRLVTYKNEEGTISKVNELIFNSGSGPRHVAFHPSGKYAYVMTELSNEVYALSYDAETGKFEIIDSASTLPSDFTENSQGSAIHVSADGKFVYAGNRGHNSIASFAIDSETGKLSFVEHTSTAGNWPRDFVLDPTEKFLVAVNERSNDLSLYKRDEQSGKLTLLQSEVPVPEPVCVKFMHYNEAK